MLRILLQASTYQILSDTHIMAKSRLYIHVFMHTLTKPDSQSCLDGFSGSEDWPSSCCKVVQQKANWFNAKWHCLDQGAHLAEINSEEEIQQIYRIFGECI